MQKFEDRKNLCKLTIMRKVFSYFEKERIMKKGSIIGGMIGASIVIIILVIILISSPKSETVEVEDTLDKEVIPETETPEVEEKIDGVEKINLENEYSPKPREWLTSGPFQIDRSEYAIGEKIFLVMGGINENEKGQIAFMRPLNDTHYSVYITIPFDGIKKDVFNYYVEPQISKTKKICSIDDIIGKWAVVFRGTDYPNLYFEITDNVVPGTNIEPAC
jgi:hypothetical protein